MGWLSFIPFFNLAIAKEHCTNLYYLIQPMYSQMSLNNDFSFVRFLKVVKTLYESSVFTKIGKTVGSELDKQLPARDDETVTDGSLVTMPENEPDSSTTNTNSSIFQMLTCQVSKALAAKVINCTLHAPDEYSDDETIPHNNTVDEDDHDDDATTDTYGTGQSSQR